MIRNARRELAKKGVNEKKPRSTKKEENKEPPSFLSGFLLIFLGSITFSIFFQAGQTLIGIVASAAFIIIGMSRVFKSSAARAKPEQMPSNGEP